MLRRSLLRAGGNPYLGADACTLERTAAPEGGTVRPEKSALQLSAQTPEWGETGPRMCARLCWRTGEQKASLSFIYKKYTRFILQTRLLKFIVVAHSQSWCQLFKQRRLKPSWTHQSFLCREKQYKNRACIFLLDREQWFLCFIPWQLLEEGRLNRGRKIDREAGKDLETHRGILGESWTTAVWRTSLRHPKCSNTQKIPWVGDKVFGVWDSKDYGASGGAINVFL